LEAVFLLALPFWEEATLPTNIMRMEKKMHVCYLLSG
jgi:hypothetical protein